MNTILVSELLKQKPHINSNEISFVYLEEMSDLYKNRFYNNLYTISFILDGQKEIFGTSGSEVIIKGQSLLMPAGNSIISEHRSEYGSYSRILVIFPRDLILNFISKNHFQFNKTKNSSPISFIRFSANAYLEEYAIQIKNLILKKIPLSYPVALHKVEELLLILFESYKDKIIHLLNSDGENNLISLKNLVENNLMNHLSLEELAFLSNRSLSSFKRDFEKIYADPPQKYMRTRKMEMVVAELVKGKHPNELYDIFGYENLSNFNTAFKKQFGVTPAAYLATIKSR